MNHTHVFQFWRPESEIKGLADPVSGGDRFLVHRRRLLAQSTQVGRGEGAPWDFFCKDTNSLITNHLPEAPPPNTNTLGVRI